MGLFGRQQRSWQPDPVIPPNSAAGRWSTRTVSLARTDSALQKIAVYASVDVIRKVVMSLPLDLYTRGPDGQSKEIPKPAWLEDLGGDQYGLTDWLAQVAYCDAMTGNPVGKIVARDPQSGKPRQIVLQHPDDVSVHRDADGKAEWHMSGMEVPAQDVWHRRYFPLPGCVWSLSPIGAHRLTIGLGLASEQYGAQFFLDGGHPTAIFKNTQRVLDPKQSNDIKAKIRAVLSGNREPLVVGADWDYSPIQITPDDSQFLATNQYTNSECARIFGPGMPAILGYETGGSLTYANVEQYNLQLLTFTLDPWLVRLEQMIYDILPRPQYVKFNRAALLRSDVLTRFQAHQIALANDFETVNEVRALEEMPPVEWGDTPQEAKTPVPQMPAPTPVSGAKT
jgi:HK97 family phage portal protein